MKFGETAISRISFFVACAALLAATSHGAQNRAGPASIDAQSFRCITSMTHVRHFYVDNLNGDLQGTISAANAKNGAATKTLARAAK